MQSTKEITTLWVRWKKPAILLDPKGVEDAKDDKENTDDNYTVEPVYSRHLVMAGT